MPEQDPAAQEQPWKSIFRTGDSFAQDPSLEADIHADERLSANARGILISCLTYPANYPFDLRAQREDFSAALEELHTLGYLRVGDYAPAIGGGLVNVVLHGRPPVAEAGEPLPGDVNHPVGHVLTEEEQEAARAHLLGRPAPELAEA